MNDDQNSITYYKVNLPMDFDTSAVYTIKLNLYSGQMLVGQIDATFIYEGEK